MSKVGIIGAGIIGGALEGYFRDNKVLVSVVDPPKNRDEALAGSTCFFVCVPAPTNPDRTQDLSFVHDALVRASVYGKTVFLRSTVLPGTCDALTAQYQIPVIALPEFLTTRTADQDIMKQPLVCGALESGKEFPLGRLELLIKLFPGKRIYIMKNKEAELAKYAHNCFAAVKINYFNVMNALCQKMSLDYDRVLQGVLSSGYIEAMHTMVPGPDGAFGFGGPCFPKDLSAFIGFNGQHLSSAIFEATEKDNGIFRCL